MNGEELLVTSRAAHYLLIDAVTAPANGVWIDTLNYDDGSLEVSITTSGTVEIRGSNAATRPSDATHGQQIGSSITASRLCCIDRLPRWLKARPTAVSGALTVAALLRKKVI